jgi:transposase-like protein
VRSWQKYSDEQKRISVEHFLNHDCCIPGAIKALGYPCRDTLAAWIKDLHSEASHHVVGKASGALYDPEVKQAALIELCTRQSSAQAVAQKIESLRRDVWQLQLEHDLLKKANELLKKTWASTCHF